MNNCTGAERVSEAGTALKKHVLLYAGFLVLALALLLVMNSSGARADDIGGTYDTDTTLTYAGSPYYLTDNVTVTEGATLYIEDGVAIYCDGGYMFDVYGAVQAGNVAFYSADDIDVLLRNASINGQLGFWANGNVSLTIISMDLDSFSNGIYVENGGWTEAYVQDANMDTWGANVYIDSASDVTLGVDTIGAYSYWNAFQVNSGGDATIGVQYGDLGAYYWILSCEVAGDLDVSMFEVQASSDYGSGLNLDPTDVEVSLENVSISSSGAAVYAESDASISLEAKNATFASGYESAVYLSAVADIDVDFFNVSCESFWYTSALYATTDGDAYLSMDECDLSSYGYAVYVDASNIVLDFDDTTLSSDSTAMEVNAAGTINAEFENVWVSSSYGGIVLQSGGDLYADFAYVFVGGDYSGYGIAILAGAGGEIDFGMLGCEIYGYDSAQVDVIGAGNVTFSAEACYFDGEGDSEDGVTVWAQDGAANVTVVGCHFASIYGSDGWSLGSLAAPYAGALSIMAAGSLNVTIGTSEEGNLFEDVGTAIAVACLPGTNSVSDVRLINNAIVGAEYGMLVEFLGNCEDALGTNALHINVVIQENSISECGIGIALPMQFLASYDEFLDHIGAAAQEVSLHIVVVENSVQTTEGGIGALVQNHAVAYTENVSVTSKTAGALLIQDNYLESTGGYGVRVNRDVYAEGFAANANESSLVSILDNTVVTSAYGEVDYGMYLYDDVEACYNDSLAEIRGGVCVDRNTVEISGGYGIFVSADVYAGDDDEHTGAAAALYLADLEVNDNYVAYAYYGELRYGIYVSMDVEAYDGNQEANFTGAVMIEDNEAYVWGPGANGIYYYSWIEARYDFASAVLNAPVTIDGNSVSALCDSYYDDYDYYYGIYHDYGDVRGIYAVQDGEAYYDNALIESTGALAITNNDVEAQDYQVTFWYYNWWWWGYWSQWWTDSYNGYGILTDPKYEAYYGASAEINLAQNISGNSVSSDYETLFAGIYVHNYLYAYDDAVVSAFGQVLVEENTVLGDADNGIYIDEYAYAYYGFAEVAAQIQYAVSTNNVSGADRGIYFYGYAFAEYENAFVNATEEVVIEANNVSGDATNGICVHEEAYAYYDFANVIQNRSCTITGNKVDGAETCIYFYEYAFAEYDYAVVNLVGDATIEQNDLVVMDGNSGIRFYYYAGAEEDSASVNATNDFLIGNNEIESADSGSGIVVELMEAYAQGDQASVEVAGDMVISCNRIALESGDGIEAYYAPYVEAYYGAAAEWNGNLCIVQNDIEIKYAEYGIYLYYAYVYAEYDDSVALFCGDVNISNNDVKLTEGTGIEVNEFYVGADYEDASAIFHGDLIVSRNLVSALYGNGIEIYDVYVWSDNEYEFTSSVAKFDGSIIVQANDVSSEDGGIFVYYYAYAYTEDGGDALAEITGDVVICGNFVMVKGDYDEAIEVEQYLYAEAYYLGYNATAKTGQLLIQSNEIAGEGQGLEGIYVYIDFYAYSDEANAYALAAQTLVSANDIQMTGDYSYGIDLYVNEFYVYAYDNAVAEGIMEGGLNVLNNDISMTGYDCEGMYLEYEDVDVEAYYGYELCNATIDFETTIDGNLICMSGDYGYGIDIDVDVYAEAYEADVGVFANVTLSDNLIELDGTDGYGIYAYVDYDSYEYRGDLQFNIAVVVLRNDVSGAGDEGYGLYVDEAYELIVCDNFFHNCGYGAYIAWVEKVVFSGNTVRNNLYDGAEFYYDDAAIIEENEFLSNGEDGVQVYYCNYAVFGNNTVRSNGVEGLYAYDNHLWMYNGIFADNFCHGVYVYYGSNVWIIDASCDVRNNGVYFEGLINVVDGGILTLDFVNDFEVYEDQDGVGAIVIDFGGTLRVQNCIIYGWYLFQIDGTLDMDNTKVYGGKELYLGPTCTADIQASMIMYMDWNGIHIDGCSPRIIGTVVAMNDGDGIFVEGADSEPIIEGCSILANSRGIYSDGASLGRVIDNLVAMNSVAGLYVVDGFGKVLENTFLLNKVEIYLIDSDLEVLSNHIGYSTKLSSLYSLMLVLEEFGDLGYWAAQDEMVTDILTNHVGIYAESSTLTTSGNAYGMLTTALYAVDSDVVFGDNIVPCGCETATIWYLSEYETEEMSALYLWGDLVMNVSVSTGVTNGMFLKGGDFEASGITIQVVEDGIFMEGATAHLNHITMVCGEDAFYLVDDSFAEAACCSFETARVEDTSLLSVLNALTVICKNADNKTIQAQVQIFRAGQSTPLYTGGTDASGQMVKLLVAYNQTAAGIDKTVGQYVVRATIEQSTINQTVDMSGGSQTVVLQAEAQKASNTILGMDPGVLSAVVLIIVIAILLGVFLLRRKK